MSSPNPRAQILTRLIAWLDVLFAVRFSSSIFAGFDNIRDDAGCRVSNSSPMLKRFNDVIAGWLQKFTEVSAAKLTSILRYICATAQLPTPPSPSTTEPSPAGRSGVC